ncbi:uncharacterized protein J8A68_005503 [[Candida] subhashii]|uniref:Uncharacterized protein n=1 Tax=[Candida] subhashii TaxID=561895 RepID=A0A8J5QHC2_9ASCO|nr:uncharacterized protein J8A68_005503 [[Candida] subhashii]KAG7660983.1 hypothetical protein J8A68_005503 [[Candida] subhashii]
MFSKITDRFHKSNDSKAKLLNFKEVYELDKKLKKYYFAGLFQKNQATARFISKYQRAKTTEPIPTRMIDFLKQTYQEEEELPTNEHELFVSISMSEDLESCNSDPVDTNTAQLSIVVQEPIATTITDITTATTAPYTTTTAVASATTFTAASTAASATTIITNMHPAAAVPTNNQSILYTVHEEDEEEEEESEIHAKQNIPKPFGSEVLISWYVTKTNCQRLTINCSQKSKALLRSISRKNMPDKERCNSLGVDGNPISQNSNTKFSKLDFPTDSYSIAILRTIKMEQKSYGWEYPVDSYTHYLLANHPSLSSKNFQDSPKPTRSPVPIISHHSKTANTFKQDEECENIKSDKENCSGNLEEAGGLHHIDLEDLEVGYQS